MLIGGCSLPAHQTAGGTPASATQAASPAPGKTLSTLPTETVEPSATPPGPRPRTAYRLDLKFDYTKHTAAVLEEISYASPASQPLTELDLVVEPNHYPGAFSLASAAVDGQAVTSPTLDGHKLVLPLAKPLTPGQSAQISIAYTLVLQPIPPASGDRRPVIFGYSDRQTNLVDWYPYLGVYRDGTGWLIHDAWVFGEHQVYESSDYQVTLTLINPIPGLVVAASSAAAAPGGGATYQIEAARTFALSISPEYVTTTLKAGAVTITGYAFPWDKAAGEKAAQDTAAAVELYSQLYGAYPHASLSLVEADFLDGMEYDGLYFLSRGFYNLYDGTSKGYLTAIAVHETAHQWWFGRVGDDQALEPWLDEAFATYSELAFYEHNDPDLVDWWWKVRIQYYQPTGWINHPIYDYNGFSAYRNAVYFRGMEFLDDLRKQMGDQAFYAFLNDLVKRYGGGQMTGSEFFATLKEHTTSDIQPLIKEYFDPQVKQKGYPPAISAKGGSRSAACVPAPLDLTSSNESGLDRSAARPRQAASGSSGCRRKYPEWCSNRSWRRLRNPAGSDRRP